MRLPEDVIASLRSEDPDLAKAVVAMTAKRNVGLRSRAAPSDGDAPELVQVAPGRFLIAIDRKAIRRLPGCELVPFGSSSAFVALDPGCGLADLALAAIERLEDPALKERERRALVKLRDALRSWRRDRTLTSVTRSLVMVRRRSGITAAFSCVLDSQVLEFAVQLFALAP